MKKLFGIATATVFGLGIFSSSAQAETIVTADVLNVRENPTTDSQIVGKVLEGSQLDVTNTLDGWSQVQLNGKEAFVSSEFTKSIYYVTAGVLNVRAEPNTNSEVLGKLTKNQAIEATHQIENGWLQFEYEGQTAYVYAPYVTDKAPVIEKQEAQPAPAQEQAAQPAPAQEQAAQPAPAQEQAAQPAPAQEQAAQPAPAKEQAAPSGGRELEVVATAYTADPSENGGTSSNGHVLTAMGHDLTANPDMKVIAVDPNVIPLGSKVWVEGYGEAIAGDTGGAIKGNRIDVLVDSNAAAEQWGRKTVTVKILD